MLGILSMEDLLNTVGKEFMDEVVKQRVGRGMRLRVVRSQTKETQEGLWPSGEAELRDVRFAPTQFVFSLTTYIVANTVLFISTQQEGFAMMIESRELSATQRNLFEVLWGASVNAQ